MRYILKMLSAFAAGLYLVVKSADLAADGKPVSAFLLGLVVFALFAWMAWLSAEAERAARTAARSDNTVTISAGKTIIGGKLYDIPAQTYNPDQQEDEA